MGPNQVKSFCTGKENINKTERQPIGCLQYLQTSYLQMMKPRKG